MEKKTFDGFNVIGDTSKIGAASRNLSGFKVIGDTSKIGANSSLETTPAAQGDSRDQWAAVGGGRKSAAV